MTIGSNFFSNLSKFSVNIKVLIIKLADYVFLFCLFLFVNFVQSFNNILYCLTLRICINISMTTLIHLDDLNWFVDFCRFFFSFLNGSKYYRFLLSINMNEKQLEFRRKKKKKKSVKENQCKFVKQNVESHCHG